MGTRPGGDPLIMIDFRPFVSSRAKALPVQQQHHQVVAASASNRHYSVRCTTCSFHLMPAQVLHSRVGSQEEWRGLCVQKRVASRTQRVGAHDVGYDAFGHGFDGFQLCMWSQSIL